MVEGACHAYMACADREEHEEDAGEVCSSGEEGGGCGTDPGSCARAADSEEPGDGCCAG